MARRIEIAKTPVQTWGCVSLFEVRDVASGRLAGREVRVAVSTEGVIAIRPFVPARGGLASILGTLVARNPGWHSGSQGLEERQQAVAYQYAIDELGEILAAQLERSDIRSFDRDLD